MIYMKFLPEQIHLLSKKVGEGVSSCTQDEINQMEGKLGAKLPISYKEFLLIMGKEQPCIFSDYKLYEPFDHHDAVQPILHKLEKALNLKFPSDGFIFMQHLLAYFAFFKLSDGDDPPIYCYDETDFIDDDGKFFKQSSFKKVANSFSSFIKQELESALSEFR